jgi:hypothetical protein
MLLSKNKTEDRFVIFLKSHNITSNPFSIASPQWPKRFIPFPKPPQITRRCRTYLISGNSGAITTTCHATMRAVGFEPIIGCALAWEPVLAITTIPSSVSVFLEIIPQAVGTGDRHLCWFLVGGCVLCFCTWYLRPLCVFVYVCVRVRVGRKWRWWRIQMLFWWKMSQYLYSKITGTSPNSRIYFEPVNGTIM